jgi:hypothetical protein
MYYQVLIEGEVFISQASETEASVAFFAVVRAGGTATCTVYTEEGGRRQQLVAMANPRDTGETKPVFLPRGW